MNGRIAKLLRKDSGYEPNNREHKLLKAHPSGRWYLAGPQRTLYQLLKKEYVYGKAQRKAEALLRT
jgi:hypothetical protein